MFDHMSDTRKSTSAQNGAEDCFARNCATQSKQPQCRYYYLCADTVYAVSVFVLAYLLLVAVLVYLLQVRVSILVLAVLFINLLSRWLVCRAEYKVSSV